MKENDKNAAAHTAGLVPVTGKVPALSSKNLKRLSVFLTQGRNILSESGLSASGSFQIHVAPQLARDHDVFAVLGPKGLDAQSLANHTDLPRVALSTSHKHETAASTSISPDTTSTTNSSIPGGFGAANTLSPARC
jgi:hypothetical protein